MSYGRPMLRDMKKLGIIAVAVLLLAGCAASSDEAFLQTVGEKHPHLVEGKAGETSIDLAHAVCAVFDNGGTAYDVARAIDPAGAKLGETGTLVIASVEHYCPEHDSAVR